MEDIKVALVKSEKENAQVLLVSEGDETAGILGLVNCLTKEPGGANLRSFFIQDAKAVPFSISAYAAQLQKDLVHNVFKAGVFGSYRHISLDSSVEKPSLQVEHAYINTLVRGDLASLRWIEGPLTFYK